MKTDPDEALKNWISNLMEQAQIADFEGFYDLGDSAIEINNLIQLFNSFDYLAAHYSWSQINSLFWFILSSGGCTEFLCVLFQIDDHDTDNLNLLRKTCILEMAKPFEFLAKSPLSQLQTDALFYENFYYMWWDLVYTGMWMAFKTVHPNDATTGETRFAYNILTDLEKELFDATISTLKIILQLDCVETDFCALHGLGHSAHPDAPKIVDQYIDKYRSEMNDEEYQFCLQCKNGTIM